MALRIAGRSVAGAPLTPTADGEPTPEPMPEGEPYPEVLEAPPEVLEEPSGGTLDPAVAGYRDPEAGPFQCSNCEHFVVPNACEHVSGYVDEAAICNLFTTKEAPLEASEGLLDEY